MKIISNSGFRIPNSECASRKPQFVIRNSERGLGASKRSEDGMATLVLFVLMFLMVGLVMAESGALFHLHREVKMLEQQQIKRLDASQTNSVAVTKPETK